MSSVKPKQKNNPVDPLLVVGIGASAGGSEALQALLGALPDSSNMSFIVILHIDRAASDVLPEVLSKSTKLPVQEIEGGMHIKPGHIYTAPGECFVTLKEGAFQLSSPTKSKERHNPIDKFFYSLAKDQGERSVAVILSGTGSDGALGLKAVSKVGGMTLAQAPTTAKHMEMPENAIVSGMVDHVLAPVNITEELLAYAEYMQLSGEKESYEKLRAQMEEYLPEACEILLKVTGHNFRHYKLSTLTRRIQRRIQVLRIKSVRDYVAHLRQDEAEVRHLFNDLLIGVTAFFRDPDAFNALSTEVLPRLFKNRKADDTMRIWVPGCATGEEAYTLAMLVREYLDHVDHKIEMQIFATDIDEEALSQARQGAYPLSIADELSAERLKRFFVKKAKIYHVSKEIRGMVLFSVHNLINDPPFSRLDLISCRNLLIYLGSHLQKKLIPLFHYALKPGGFLFLGPSENISSHRELFRPLNAKYRISQRLPTVVHTTTLFTSRNDPPTLVKPPNVPIATEMDTYLLMQRIVLDEFSPKALVVDEEGQIICASGNLEKYLTVTAGAFHNNATRLVREGLRVGLRTTLVEAAKTRRQVVHHNLSLRAKEGVQRIMLTVQPMPHMGDDSGLFLVVFQDVGLPTKGELVHAPANEEAGALIEQLERELLTTREDLERTVQDLEAANEELKSSNEELLSMNEELQSANEELETSKEEVQIANDNLNRANTDLENLLASTQIATIFLDNGANVRRVTPLAIAIYNILPEDAGRPLSHFTHKAMHMPPLPSIKAIQTTKKAIENEIEMQDSSWFVRRILPYRTQEGVSEGILLMFTDITERKRSEIALRKSEERLRLALAASKLGVLTWNLINDTIIMSPRAAEIFGISTAATSWKDMKQLIDIRDRKRVQTSLDRSLEKNADYTIEYRIIRSDGERLWVLSTGHGEYDDHGKPVGMMRLVQDITERKTAMESLKNADQRKDEFLAILAHELRNPLAPLSNGLQVLRMAGNTNPEMAKKTLDTMEWQVNHMVRLVDDLLDVSRITRGKIELHKQRLCVKSIIQNAIEISRPNIDQKGHQLNVTLPDEPIEVIGDATRLSQVVANLLNNAAKYTPNGGKIQLKATCKDRQAIISIKDNGIGIPADMLSEIFDVFVQVDTAMERSQGGLGIGLTLVRKLVELHGGAIEARSAGPGKGSQFIISLPLVSQ